jgi:hypothetical protein
MTPLASARLRLVLASVLLGGWLAYLGWLAWSNARPHVSTRPFQIAKTHYEVLSHSQFLVADIDASVTVDKDGNVKNTPEVLWAGQARNDSEAGPENLKDELIEDAKEGRVNIKKELEKCGLEGTGPFLVPFVHREGTFQVATVPDMPGAHLPEVSVPQEQVAQRVYHDTPKTREQERDIRKPYR